MSIWVVTHYAGQIIEPEDFESKPVFGSELALLEVFQRLDNVTVFISKPKGYMVKNYGITWRSEQDWPELIKTPPKHIVISRYMSAMCELYMPSSCKIWLWCHDVTPHTAFQGKQLSPNFTRNMQRRLSGIITVGDSQRDEIILPQYKLDREKFTTIKNGITPTDFEKIVQENKENNIELKEDTEKELNKLEEKLEKAQTTKGKGSIEKQIKELKEVEIPSIFGDRAPMSFVYSSGSYRGLWNLLKLWPSILKRWPWATLQIFHSLSDEDKEKIRKTRLPRIHPMGRVNQVDLFKKLRVIDYWVYPCTFFETCCTTAIEMGYYGPICISNKLGALKENNKGLLLENKTFGEDVLKKLEWLEEHPQDKENIRIRQHEWAKKQTWDKRADEWKKLLKI